MRCQYLGGRQRFLEPAATDEERGVVPLVDDLHQQARRQGERLLQHAFRLSHLADVLIRRRQQIEIVRVMPVELGGNLFLREVIALQLVCGFELRDRFRDASAAAQFVPVHVARVRDVHRLRSVRRRGINGLLHAAVVLERMRHVMSRRKVVWRHLEGAFVERHRRQHRSLTSFRGVWRLGHAALQEQLNIIWEGG